MTMVTLQDIKNNGIVGAGGAGFPSHIKLASRPEFLILNAAECEPLIHKDRELLGFGMDAVLKGFSSLLKLTGASRGIIGIKKKNSALISSLEKKMPSGCEIIPLGDFYPAGDEVTLVYETTGRLVNPGQLPVQAGCLVQNVETVYNIGINEPVTTKFITVAGEVDEPRTLKVPVGSYIEDVLSLFRLTTSRAVILSGGCMMGSLAERTDVITKCTAGLIVLPSDHPLVSIYRRYRDKEQTVKTARAACDQCSFCTELCPRYLLGHPVRSELSMRNRMFPVSEPSVHKGSRFCCECNLCTLYACPEGLDPRGATIIEKRQLSGEKTELESLKAVVHPMLPYRKVPTRKLMQRLDVLKYRDEAPLDNLEWKPARVSLPLKQHAGSPAQPVVRTGQRVNKGDLVAEAQERISARIHASIDGVVEVGEESIIIEAEAGKNER